VSCPWRRCRNCPPDLSPEMRRDEVPRKRCRICFRRRQPRLRGSRDIPRSSQRSPGGIATPLRCGPGVAEDKSGTFSSWPPLSGDPRKRNGVPKHPVSRSPRSAGGPPATRAPSLPPRA
jgi:hypothetical protein